MKIKTIKSPAVKTSPTKIVSGSITGKHTGIGTKGERGFLGSDNKFMGRGEASKVAAKSGQIKTPAPKKLHTTQLLKKHGIKQK